MSAKILMFPSVESSETSVEEAYGVLIEGLRRSLYRYGVRRARGVLGPGELRQLVAEVADETFTRALHQRESYDPSRAPVLWWLFMLGRKQMFLELRRLWRDRQALEATAGQLEVEELEPTRSRGGREFRLILERDRLGRALEDLAPDQLQALGLFYLLDMSLEEVGKLLGKSPAAVSSLLQRARKNARARLERGKGDTP